MGKLNRIHYGAINPTPINMIIVLGSSIAIRILAVIWSVILLRRIRDWRIGFLTVMFTLMAVRQSLTLFNIPPSSFADFTLSTSELPGLVVSIMAFLSIFSLEKILSAPQKAKRDLDESEKRFHQLVEHLEEIFWITSIDGEQVVYVSPAYEDIFCRSLSEFKQNPKVWMDYILPEDRLTVQEAFTESNLVRGNFNVEYRIQRPDKSIRWIKAKGFPVKNKLGETYRIAGIATDITQKKIYEISLQQSQTLFQTLARVSPVGIFHTDEKGFCTFVNDQWSEITGLTLTEAQGSGWASALHPDDRDRVFAEWNNFTREGKTFQMEYRFMNASGQSSWVFGQAEAERDFENNVIGYVGAITDITQQKSTELALKNSQAELEHRVEERTADLAESEERFRSLVTQAVDAFFVHDFKGRFVDVNNQACESLGYTRDELLSLSVPEIEVNFDAKRVEDTCKKMVPGKTIQVQGTHRRKDGSTFPVEVYLGLIDMKGETFMLSVARDVTQRMEVENQLRKAQEAAEKSSRAKSEFLSHMSHELRTPLNAILGFAQLLGLDTKKSLTPRQKENVEQIRIAGNHLLELINEVLDLARIESGSLKVFNENTDVSKLLEKLLPVVDRMAKKKDVRIKNQLSTTGPLTVFADPTRLKQALINLVTNAIKYNNDGGEVFIKGETTDGGRVKVHVIDTGRGIEADKQQLLFEPFERLGAEQSGIEGTGIGLSITRKLTELMNGTVSLESEVGKGSCFTIELPVGMPPTSVPEGPSLHKPHPLDPLTIGQHQSILYIEDNISNLNLVQKYIEGYTSFKFLASLNPVDGIAVAREYQPTIILMDINLPGMNGIQAFNELQKHGETKCIPVIAVSANAMDSDIDKALKAGFKKYLTKPLDLDLLTKTLQEEVKSPS